MREIFTHNVRGWRTFGLALASIKGLRHGIRRAIDPLLGAISPANQAAKILDMILKINKKFRFPVMQTDERSITIEIPLEGSLPVFSQGFEDAMALSDSEHRKAVEAVFHAIVEIH